MSKNSVMRSLAPAALLAVALSACGPTHGPGAKGAAAAPSALVLRDDGGRDETLGSRAAKSNLTVLLFFSSDCPVQKAHDPRIRELVEAYRARGVSFYAVVSEVGADMKTERQAARERGLDLPVLEDRGAALADSLGVEYSTHSVLIDRSGGVLYSGGIDSDRTHLSAGAERWLERAIQASIAGTAVDKPKTEAMGCALRKH
jgi:thiol-disulfide isomerase/thioredoxin